MGHSHFVFTDNEVERESPTKGKSAPNTDIRRVNQPIPIARGINDDETEQQERILAFLKQQEASLAALQEKKRRLESAQAEVRMCFVHILSLFCI
jgi:hypothetical protein